MTTEMMPMPEMGLDDEPTRPAMYPQAAATRKPMKKASAVHTTTSSQPRPLGMVAASTK